MTFEKKRRLREARTKADELLKRVSGSSEAKAFSDRLTMSSLEAHVRDLEQQELVEISESNFELLEFRLIGNLVPDGSIPLGILGRLSGPLSDALTRIGSKLRFGDMESEQARGVIERLLDVRLIGLATGSTRLLLRANASTDLNQESLFRQSTERLFTLLNSNYENFFDSVHEIGPRAARAVEHLMKSLEDAELSASLSWETEATKLTWSASTPQIAFLRSLLERVEEKATDTVKLSGVVSLVSDTGRIELREPGRERATKVRVSRLQVPLLHEFRVGDNVTLRVLKTTFYDPVENRSVEKYELVESIAEPPKS